MVEKDICFIKPTISLSEKSSVGSASPKSGLWKVIMVKTFQKGNN